MNALERYGKYIVPAVLAVTLLAWFLAPKDRAKPIHGPCLVHGDCHDTERCLVKPAKDGFATFGVCAEPCENDLQCPARFHCEEARDAKAFWIPPSAAKANEPTVSGCVEGLRPPGDAG